MNHSIARSFLYGLALCLPLSVQAASTLVNNVTGGTGTKASADLKFKVVIPGVLFLRIGTGPTSTAAQSSPAGTVDEITFTVPSAQVGQGNAGVTTTGGDVGGGKVSVELFSNVGLTSFTVSTNNGGNLISGANQILFSDIQVQKSTNAGTGDLSHGAGLVSLPTTGIATLTVASAVQGIHNHFDEWEFQYKNSAIYPAGTYTGTATYTATVP